MSFRILLVDDSVLARHAVSDIIKKIPDAEVCGEASNGEDALEKIIKLKPDIVILDVEMPVLNGIGVLKEIRSKGLGVPVLMLSVLTQLGAQTTIEALMNGALDFVPKPGGRGVHLDEVEKLLLAKLHGIIHHIKAKPALIPVTRPIKITEEKRTGSYELVVIGSSTGGPQALHYIMKDLPAKFPVPIIIIQHMPPLFTAAFADRLDHVSPLHILEAKDGIKLERGCAYVCPGNMHLKIENKNGSYFVKLSDDPPVHAHRPSVDVTLDSVVETVGKKCIGVIMTGMGWDGAQGMKKLHEIGGVTLAQDEASSVVYGMNRRAVELGAIQKSVPLKNLVEVLMSYFDKDKENASDIS